MEFLRKVLSREFLVAVAGFVIGTLQTLGVVVEAELADKVIGAAVAIAALVAYVIARTIQKKHEA